MSFQFVCLFVSFCFPCLFMFFSSFYYYSVSNFHFLIGNLLALVVSKQKKSLHNTGHQDVSQQYQDKKPDYIQPPSTLFATMPAIVLHSFCLAWMMWQETKKKNKKTLFYCKNVVVFGRCCKIHTLFPLKFLIQQTILFSNSLQVDNKGFANDLY